MKCDVGRSSPEELKLLKVRVFALAKELGVDSKELIEYCSDLGIQVKSSALASITPEERDKVVAYYEEKKAGGGETAQDEQEIAPVRDESAAEKVGKVRKLKARSAKARSTSKPQTEEGGDVATVTEEPEPSEAPEETGKAAPSKKAEAAETAEAETEAGKSEEETSETKKIQPISKEDYTPSASAMSRMREMKPIGSGVSEREEPKPKPKPKSKQQKPAVASAPSVKLPKPKKAKEEGAQKPDIRLNSELFDQQASPLGEQLRRSAEKKARRGDKEEQIEEEGGRRGRSLIEERRRNKRKLTETGTEEEAAPRTRPTRRPRRRGKSQPAQLKTEATIALPINLRGLSEALGRPANDLMKTLMQQGEMLTINDMVDEDTALMLAMEHGVDLTIKEQRDVEEELEELFNREFGEEELQPRPPIITVLGHVDHGKTTLVDKLRSANVAAGEAGGITQHIAAYQINHNGQKITFVDTPGHAAFGEMRARGANVTDIIVLVVAADDGVMPQTVECISHARSADVPIVVAMNKMDLPGVNEQKVLQELAQHEVIPSEWGGDVEVVRTSGETGEGLDDLLETVLLTAELHEYKGNPDRDAIGVCLEAFRDEGRGPIAWLIVKDGTLRIGDDVLCGSAFGRIRAIYNDRGEEIEEAPPSLPVKVSGFDSVPGAGDKFYVMDDIERAREIADEREHIGRTALLARRKKPASLEDILGAVRQGKVQDLSLIVKADTPGSLEAIRSEVEKFEHPEVRVNVIHEGVGGVNESDVYLAAAGDAVIIAFHVIAEDRAESLADSEGVEIRRYKIIYELIQDIRDALEGMLAPERVEIPAGRALVLKTFSVSRAGTIAGCRVLNGSIDRDCHVHVIRDQTIINDYPIASLRREKDDVKEVREGMECGIRLDGFNDVKEGDLLEAYRIEEKKRTLEDVPAESAAGGADD
jgi:translation initiation factor IF-2